MKAIDKIITWICIKIRLIVFILLTVLTIFASKAVLTLEINDGVSAMINNVSYSIIAAYIFYLINDVIPNIIKFYDNKKRNKIIMSITYRKLQLLLASFDGIFLETYKGIHKVDYKGNLYDFFNLEFLIKLVDNFDLRNESNTVAIDKAGNQIKLNCETHFYNTWRKIKDLGQNLLSTQYITKNEKLAYEVEFLLSESSISTYFDYISSDSNHTLTNIFPVDVKTEKRTDKRWIECVINLHKIAFKMYDELKKENYLRNIFAPKFYNEM